MVSFSSSETNSLLRFVLPTICRWVVLEAVENLGGPEKLRILNISRIILITSRDFTLEDPRGVTGHVI